MAAAVAGLIGPGPAAQAELDLNDRPAMMQLADDLLRCVIAFNFMALKAPDGPLRTAREKAAADYFIATLHLYKLLKVLDDEALARARWNAMFEHVKWADAQGALDVEMKICGQIEPLQRELVARWRLDPPSEGE
jgi:hypothetical protein